MKVARLSVRALGVFLLSCLNHLPTFASPEMEIDRLCHENQLHRLDKPVSAKLLGGLVVPGHLESVLYQSPKKLTVVEDETIDEPVTVDANTDDVRKLLTPDDLASFTPLTEAGATKFKVAYSKIIAQHLDLNGLKRADVFQSSTPGQRVFSNYSLVDSTLSARQVEIQSVDGSAAGSKILLKSPVTLAYGIAKAKKSPGLTLAEGDFSKVNLGDLFKLFEAKKVTIKSIESKPSDCELGYLEEIRFIESSPERIADERFHWIGSTPMSNVELWPETFYFRVKNPRNNRQIRTKMIKIGRNSNLENQALVIEIENGSK